MHLDLELDSQTGQIVEVWRHARLPPLKILDKEEYRERQYLDKVGKDDRVKDLPWLEEGDPWSIPLYFTIFRIADSLIGFHKGSLDMSGRHEKRYTALFDLWSILMKDTANLQGHATEYTITERRSPDFEFIRTDYRLDTLGETLWQDMGRKWRFSQHFKLVTLMIRKDAVSRAMEDYSLPIFQKLLLVCLPVELLGRVYELLSLDCARTLSATCRDLRSIGMRYIFHSRELRLEADYSMLDLQGSTDGNDSERLLHRALLSRKQFVTSCEFLLSRSDILDSVRSLTFANCWSPAIFLDRLCESKILDNDPSYYNAIMAGVEAVTRASMLLTTLRLSGFDLTIEVLDAIGSLAGLELLTLDECWLPVDVRERIQEGLLDLLPTVLNVHLILDAHRVDVCTLWHVLPLFPQIRTLAIVGPSESRLYVAPLEDILRLCHPFETLERLSLYNFARHQVELLAWWFWRSAYRNSPQPTLRLTHLDVHCGWAIWPQHLDLLLQTLGHCAPVLEVLCLDGIPRSAPSLLGSVAQTLPNLLGLTVMMRASDKPRRTSLVSWPAPCWEYAQQLSHFRRLRYFGCNMGAGDFDRTPYTIVRAEKNYSSMSRAAHIYDFHDHYLLGGPFAAHCPTLEHFAINSQRFIQTGCHVVRDATGFPRLVEVDFMTYELRDFSIPWCPRHTSFLDTTPPGWPSVTRWDLAARLPEIDISQGA